jgi:hypothetical protein
MKNNMRIFQLRISLMDSEPEIWRRVLVPEDYSLGDLHDVIQIAMGWENAHLHGFRQKDRTFGPKGPDSFENEQDEEEVLLSDVLKKSGSKILYEYDFGDSWEHAVSLEKVLKLDATTTLPSCIEGENACPPEDVGGISSYNSIVHALTHDNDGDGDEEDDIDEELLEWLGDDFSPERFDVEGVNETFKQWNDYREGKGGDFLDEDDDEDFDDEFGDDDECGCGCGYEYDASVAPDLSKWRTIKDRAKIHAIEDYHLLAEPDPDPESFMNHVAVHLTVEEHVAAGDPPEVGEAMARLMNEGLSRHDAIHAIGTVIFDVLDNLSGKTETFDLQAYKQGLSELTVEKWLSYGEQEQDRKVEKKKTKKVKKAQKAKKKISRKKK